MRRIVLALMVPAFLAGTVFVGGCETDRTVAEHHKSGSTWTGGHKSETTVVKERPDGTRYTERESSRVSD